MIYNLAAVFDDTVRQGLLAFAKDFQERNDCEFEYTNDSILHATLVKREAESDPFTSLTQKEFEVALSGLTLLPSRSGEDSGLWVEISVLIPQQLRLLISDLTEALDAAAIQSEVGDLSPTLLRKSDVKIQLQVGKSGTGFSYERIA